MPELVSEKELEAAIAKVLELPEGLAVAEVFAFVGDCRPGLYKAKVLPSGKGLDFEILVAQTMIDIDLTGGPPAKDLAVLAHIISHARLVLAGSKLPQGPYGDLFYRVLIGVGAALDQIGIKEHGAAPTFDEAERIGSPLVRMFLNQVSHRFSEALRGEEPHTREGELVDVLEDLAIDLAQNAAPDRRPHRQDADGDHRPQADARLGRQLRDQGLHGRHARPRPLRGAGQGQADLGSSPGSISARRARSARRAQRSRRRRPDPRDQLGVDPLGRRAHHGRGGASRSD